MIAGSAERRDGVPAASSKITPRHLERLGIVYVRQSHYMQSINHPESTRVQYSLTDHAVALGWPRERVLVIDEDQAHTATTTEGRLGFQRLVAEVGLGHVGIIVGFQMSRLARSCSDWYQLIDACALFGTLLGDFDGVYDPANYNDRLLLGLKGTISEAELYLIKQRMQTAKLAKAQRGELGMSLPIGYVRRPSGEVIKDPDEQAQHLVALIFEQFQRCGTIHGVLRYLVEHDLKLPIRVRSGPDKGELRWTRPNRTTLQDMFNNPTYAGAYAYGRRPIDPRAQKPGRPATGRHVVQVDQWAVCLRDRLPAYISWEQFEQNLRQMALNRNTTRGVARKGSALLTGLVRCGRCGRRMVTHYVDGHPRYACSHAVAIYAAPPCQSLAARAVDRVVEALLLRAIEALGAGGEPRRRRRRGARARPRRAALAAAAGARSLRGRTRASAVRRGRAREPPRRAHARAHPRGATRRRAEAAGRPSACPRGAPRLVDRGGALGDPRAGDGAAEAVEQPDDDERATQGGGPPAPGGGAREGGRQERTGRADAALGGGHETTTTLTRPVAKLSQLSYYDDLLRRAEHLRREGKTLQQVADTLNAEGVAPRDAQRDLQRVDGQPAADVEGAGHGTHPRALRRRSSRRMSGRCRRSPTELGMSRLTLYGWVQRGWVQARKVQSEHPHGVWIIRADDDELARLALRAAPRWPRRPPG